MLNSNLSVQNIPVFEVNFQFIKNDNHCFEYNNATNQATIVTMIHSENIEHREDKNMTISDGSQLDVIFEFFLNKPPIVDVTIENTLNIDTNHVVIDSNHVVIDSNIDYRVF